MYAQRVNDYATAPARLMIGKARRENSTKSMQFSCHWKTCSIGWPELKVGEITGAIDVGPAEVGGVTCEQYAFRQPGLNWQIWIQQADFPLLEETVLSH